VLLIPLTSNEGFKFSGDGARLFFPGRFREGDFVYFGLGYLDLRSRTFTLIAERTTPFFTIDTNGRRVAYQVATGSDTSGGDIDQYFLYDEATGETRQLTNDPEATAVTGDCPAQFGTTPLISADGSTVVVITGATLGVVPEDTSVGCRVFSYDVTSQQFTQVAALPKSLRKADIPVLSGDGRWLSFLVIQPFGNGGSHGVAALLDMQTGELSAPLLDAGNYTSFDSAVTRDGSAVIISSEADFDPRVGNADHNLELFSYDLATQEVSQITETLGGIGRTPGRCPSYRPSVSHDGGVVVFPFDLISVEGCQLDGPERNEADGFIFGFVRAVRKRPGNTPVVLDAVADQQVVAGDTLTLTLTAHDADGDPISFFAQTKDGLDVPPGSTITDRHDGTATFTWPTRPADVGDQVLRVAAFDEGGGEQFQDVPIAIVPRAASGCTGDCNGDRQVTIDELVLATGIVLGTVPLSACPAYGPDVAVTDLLTAVTHALSGCPVG